MIPLAETQIRSWTVHDVHFLNQLPALLEALKVYIQDLEEQLLTLERMQSLDETQPKPKGHFALQSQLQTIQQQHQNRLQYYRSLQTIVNQWQRHAQYSYQRVHCEFIDVTLKDIIELCKKIVDVADEKIKTLTLKEQQEVKSSALRVQHSRLAQSAQDLQSAPLFSDYGPSDIAFATISNDIEEIAGLLVNSNQNSPEVQKKRKTNPNPPTQESQKGFLQTWLCWGPEDCGVWIQM